jgi:hypothetical protein
MLAVSIPSRPKITFNLSARISTRFVLKKQRIFFAAINGWNSDGIEVKTMERNDAIGGNQNRASRPHGDAPLEGLAHP